MDWIKRMNNIMGYIDEHITEEIDMPEIARMACCSVNHFQRLFSFIAGTTLKEYIRRRRLTCAALELQKSRIKIIDLAMKYGYDSADSFTRSFQKMHGITPTLARTAEIVLKSYPKIVFNMNVTGEQPLNYKIVQKDEFELVGKGMMLDAENMAEAIRAFWQESYSNGSCRRLYELSGSELLYDIVAYREERDESVSFHIAYENKARLTRVDTEFEILKIPALTWVVFTLIEPIATSASSIEAATQYTETLWSKAYAEWLPTSGYTDGVPIIEVFYPDTIELWIPVERNK